MIVGGKRLIVDIPPKLLIKLKEHGEGELLAVMNAKWIVKMPEVNRHPSFNHFIDNLASTHNKGALSRAQY